MCAGYDEYSLLDLYSGFFWLLVPYSENLLLDWIASNRKKSPIFQNIQLLDTDNNIFWFYKLLLDQAFLYVYHCVHQASCRFHFLWDSQHLRSSSSPISSDSDPRLAGVHAWSVVKLTLLARVQCVPTASALYPVCTQCDTQCESSCEGYIQLLFKGGVIPSVKVAVSRSNTQCDSSCKVGKYTVG